MAHTVSDRIPIECKDGITIYGRVIGSGGKLGRYEVFSDMLGSDGSVYHTYAEAEKRRNDYLNKTKNQ